MNLSIVIPCFNERQIIEATLGEVTTHVSSKHPDLEFEIIPVDDGSTDDTARMLEAYAARDPRVRPRYLKLNSGRGGAIKAGLAASTGDKVVILDADLSYDVEHVSEILKEFSSNPRLDAVIVSAYMPGGMVKGVPWKRLAMSRLANWILSGFFSRKIHTVTCVVRGYRGSLIRSLPLYEQGKELHLEILRKLIICDAQLIEIPGRLVWREAKARGKRKTLNIVASGSRHLLWGLLSRPSRVFRYLAVLLFVLAAYETTTMAVALVKVYQPHPEFWYGVWMALNATFTRSPHTVVIASISWVIFFQVLFFLALFSLMKLQQEETLRHLIGLSQSQSSSHDSK